MPNRTKARKLEVFRLHCRDGENVVDYEDAFTRIARAKPSVRQFEDGDRLLALPRLRFQDVRKLIEFIAYEGPVGVNPLIFDAGTGNERFEPLTDSQVVATRTYGLIDVRRREAIIEYNQRGAKANDIAELLERTGRKVGFTQQFAVELNPVVDEDFLAALGRFNRIKLAQMKVARPNFDWSDNYNGLNQVGAESRGRTVELTVTAHRNDSLSRRTGIIQYIREMIQEGVTSLKGASVVGVRGGETSATRISLANYTVHQKTPVAVDGNGHVISQDIQAKIRDVHRSRVEASRR
jgi:hypothetical protein